MFKKLTPNMMVEDVAKTIAFYRDVMGFQVITTVEDGPEVVFAILSRDAVQIMLQSRKSLSNDVPALSGIAIGASQTFFVDVEDVQALHDSLQGQVEVVVALHETFYQTREFYFKDMNGYIWCYAQTLG